MKRREFFTLLADPALNATGSSLRLVALLNLLLAMVAAYLLWRSRDWPLVGDAAIFHFIAGQMQMGAVPYRDIIDVNMPLTYFVHATVVAIGGMSDVAWRVFDLGAAAALSLLIVLLLSPTGRAVAFLAALVMLVVHLLLGPYAAGQRDFLMLIPTAAAALFSSWAVEDQRRRGLYLVLAGAAVIVAAAIKPSGILLLLLPILASMRLRWRELANDAVWVAIGIAAIVIPIAFTLAIWGAFDSFIGITRSAWPLYGSLGDQTVAEIAALLPARLAPVAGFALAAALGLGAPKPARLRAIIGVTIFGVIHVFAQRKGWFYHFYPLLLGLVCWGAWSLASLSAARFYASLAVIASALVWTVIAAAAIPYAPERDPSLRAAAAIQSALEAELPRGARVQMLDSDYGAFRAMARAGMRQATPYIQAFSLMFAGEPERAAFLALLKARPPAAILLTNSQWPAADGFDYADGCAEFASLLSSSYHLEMTGNADYIAWRLYVQQRGGSKSK